MRGASFDFVQGGLRNLSVNSARRAPLAGAADLTAPRIPPGKNRALGGVPEGPGGASGSSVGSPGSPRGGLEGVSEGVWDV